MTQPAITDIGAALKAAREEKDVSVSSAAMQTNLSSRIIDKLEQNQFSEIGAPVFTRGYLTQYARFLELDAAALTAAFNRLNPDNTQLRISRANEASQNRRYRRRLGPWLTAIPLVILAGAVIVQVMNPNSWLMTQFKQAFLEEHQDQTVASAHEITLQVGGDVPPAPADSADVPASDAPVGAKLPTLTSLEDESGVPANNVPVGDTPAVGVDTTASVLNPVSDSANTAAVPAAQGSSLTLTTENWVEVRNKDKKIIASRLYKKGESIALPADGSPYDLTVGQPENTALVLNGETVPLANFRVKKNARKFRIALPQETPAQ